MQADAFRLDVFPEFPEFYQFKFDRWRAKGMNENEMLERQLKQFPHIANQFRSKSKDIESEIRTNLKTFQNAFDDFDTDFDVHIAHSLGEMDGGTRTINGKAFFIFGIDGIIKYHNSESDIPFYDHEFFHVYHSQHFVGAERIWAALWGEGLATYVSEALNPGASIRGIMLDVPSGLVEKCKADLPYLWNTLLEKLDSNSEDDYTTFFLLNSQDPRIPKRAGYYLGYLIAKEIGKGRTLKELSRLDGFELRNEIESVITKIIHE